MSQASHNQHFYRVYCDGASKGNPGPAGWATIIEEWAMSGTHKICELAGRISSATNNQMELQAALEALLWIENHVKSQQPHKSVKAEFFLDSAYVVDGVSKRLGAWVKRGWKTESGTPVQNRDLWEGIHQILQNPNLQSSWHRVAAHQGIPRNMRVDTLASDSALGKPVNLYRGDADSYGYPHEEPSLGATPQKPWYLSYAQGVLRAHPTWEACKIQIQGVSGAKTKKVFSDFEAEKIAQDWGTSIKHLKKT